MTKETSKKTVTFPVAVHKANLKMLAGESVHEYTKACGDAAKTYLKSNGIGSKKTDIYPVEVFTDKVILDVWTPSTETSSSYYKYYSAEYKRDDKGVFTFSNITEVERKTTYKPKTEMSVAKSKGDTQSEEKEWVEKSFWSGIV